MSSGVLIFFIVLIVLLLRLNKTERYFDTNRFLTPYWQAIVVSLFLFLSVLLSSYFAFVKSRAVLLNTIQNHLLAIVQLAANVTDTDAHQQIVDPAQKGSELYLHVQKPYKELLKAHHDLAYVYTVIPKADRLFLIIDTKVPKPGELDDTAAVMEEYTSQASNLMKEAIRTQTQKVENQPYTDKWGTFLSAYMPIYNSQKQFLGIVGADIRMADYHLKIASIKHNFYGSLMAGCLLSFLIGWLVYRHSARNFKTSQIQADTVDIQTRYIQIRENKKEHAQHEFLKNQETLFNSILAKILDYTKSEYGFIGEVLYEGCSPYFKAYAVSFLNASKDPDLQAFYKRYFKFGMEIRNMDNLFGEAIKTKQVVVANHPKFHPAFAGVKFPQGHPPLNKYLGIPIISGDSLLAMVGIANAKGGYSLNTVSDIHPLTNAFGSLIEAMRNDRERGELEDKYASLVKNVPAVFFNRQHSQDWNMFYFNDQIESLTGYQSHDFILLDACAYGDLINQEDKASAWQSMQLQLKQAQRYEIEYRLKCKDGTFKWVHEQGIWVAHKNHKNPILEGFMVDITARKNAEEELKSHRNQLQSLVEIKTKTIREEANKNILLRNITEAANLAENKEHAIKCAIEEICLFNKWDLGHCYLLNTQSNMFISSKIWNNPTHPQFKEFIEISELKIFSSGEGIVGEVLKKGLVEWLVDIQKSPVFVRKAQALNVGLRSGVAFPIAQGKTIVGVFEFYALQDIKKDEYVEALMRQIGVQIGRVIERFAQRSLLLEAKNAAEASAQAKSEFLSNMSHELRTPMHAILNYSKMGLSRYSDGDAEKIKKYFNNISIAGQRLLGLLNNLLDLAKMESGKMIYKFAMANFIEVIEHTQMELDSLLKGKQVRLELINHAKETQVIFDKQRMIQVIVNLFSNAIKFTPEKTVISVIVSDACLMQNGQEALCCQIIDQGEGIPPQELESVFDKFVQSSKTKTGAGGTGLGLSICKQIIEAHGGKIWAENHLPNGAKFSFLIPIKLPEELLSQPVAR